MRGQRERKFSAKGFDIGLYEDPFSWLTTAFVWEKTETETVKEERKLGGERAIFVAVCAV